MISKQLCCPFCSGRHIQLVRVLFTYHAECKDCLAVGRNARSKNEAIAHWKELTTLIQESISRNTRPPAATIY